MARENKFASSDGAKETPAAKHQASGRERNQAAVPFRFLPTAEWLNSIVNDSEICGYTCSTSHMHPRV